MWQHVSFTLSTALQTFNRLHKSWAKFSVPYAIIFLIPGFIISFCLLAGLGFLVRSSWADMENTDQYLYVWFEHALKLDVRLLITSTGLLGAYFNLNINNPEAGKQPFEKFGKSIPGAAWQLFLLMAVIQAVVYYIHLSGNMRQLADTSNGIFNHFFIESRKLFYFWLHDVIEILSNMLPFPMAGMLYLKASGSKHLRINQKAFLSLLVVGYAFHSLLTTLNYLIGKVVLSLIMIPLKQTVLAMLLSDFVYIFIYINAIMIFVYITYSAFRQEEIELEGPDH